MKESKIGQIAAAKSRIGLPVVKWPDGAGLIHDFKRIGVLP